MGVAVMFSTLAALFAVLEVGARVLETLRSDLAPGESWAIHDPELGYRNRPGWGDHNAHGLRGDPVEDPKRRFRLLVVGDSVPYSGDDATDTFPGRLEARFAADPSLEPIEVLNAGTRGYTNFQQTRWTERHGFALDPDLIAICFVLNDLHHILHRFEVVDGKITGERYAFSDEAVQRVESRLYRVLRKSRLLVLLRRQLAIADDLIALYVGGGFGFDYRPDFATAWQEEPWETVESQLAETLARARDRGIPVFLVLVPFGEQLLPEVLARDPEHVMYPQRRLAEIAERLEVPLLDLTGDLDPILDMGPDRIHLTPRGRGVTAERIARFLREEDLVPLVPQGG